MPNLDNAASEAGQASESLDQGDLSQAQQDEQEVLRELGQAEKQLEDEEEQYQKLRQEELLFRIIEEVDSLIEGHREAMLATREIDLLRSGEDRPSRAQRLRLKRVSTDESALAARSGELAAALEEESSLVFAQSLDAVRQDLERVAFDLDKVGGYRTGARTQALQEDVEEAALWLKQALEQEQERRQQEQQQGGQQEGGESENRLVPDEAELKLLRRMEVDVIERLNELLELYPELAGGEVDPMVLRDIQRLAQRHERTSSLFSRFRERLGIPDPEDPAPDADKGGN
jgi:hypothetical protein